MSWPRVAGGVHSHQRRSRARRHPRRFRLPVAVHGFSRRPTRRPNRRSAICGSSSGCRWPWRGPHRDGGRALLRDGPRPARTGSRRPTRAERWRRRACDDARGAVAAAYARGESDEFVLPTALGDYRGMKDGDGVLFANFRADASARSPARWSNPILPASRATSASLSPPRSAHRVSEELNPFLATLFPPDDLSTPLAN